MIIERVFDYRSSVATTSVSHAATRAALVVTLLIPLSFVAFRLLRRHQFSLPDPNPYTTWSTACLLAFFALAFVDLILLVALRRRVARGVRYLGSLTVLASGSYIAWFLIGMYRFLYP